MSIPSRADGEEGWGWCHQQRRRWSSVSSDPNESLKTVSDDPLLSDNRRGVASGVAARPITRSSLLSGRRDADVDDSQSLFRAPVAPVTSPCLLQALSEENENLVFSPFGLASNLMMVIENADKAAVGEIVDVFKLGKNRMQLKRGFKTLNEEFMVRITQIN
ncbi:unnamed protein product [Bemisia tabaci]|uniref:Uncharacterized protein n=1 Tax=Bemisia tabaci TaxID=7038 RepID=A0A9P0A5B0_BEMTA|nr:unnamed protein product [Bemisia tabaci]